MSDATGFQRRRRALPPTESNVVANEETKDYDHGELIEKLEETGKEPTFHENEQGETNDNPKDVDYQENDDSTATEITPEQIENMSVEEVKAELDKREIDYVHNTGLEKLKGKLLDAIS